jgi:hypothetical protein
MSVGYTLAPPVDGRPLPLHHGSFAAVCGHFSGSFGGYPQHSTIFVSYTGHVVLNAVPFTDITWDEHPDPTRPYDYTVIVDSGDGNLAYNVHQSGHVEACEPAATTTTTTVKPSPSSTVPPGTIPTSSSAGSSPPSSAAASTAPQTSTSRTSAVAVNQHVNNLPATGAGADVLASGLVAAAAVIVGAVLLLITRRRAS